MTALDLADALVSDLPVSRVGLFNPWKDDCPRQSSRISSASRLARLALHLSAVPRFILVGEAPGYAGCRYSGIAFTSERLLLDGVIPRVPFPGWRLSLRDKPFSEPSATIVWKVLYRLGIAEHVLLWNALQMHPHRPGEPWSNRTPTREEIALGAPGLKMLVEHFPCAKVIGIGVKAKELLSFLGIDAGCVRHPANGGATAFSNGLEQLVRETDRL
jgi:hypothetical protein